MLTRTDILQPIRQALEPLDYVHAMWEGGAAAFNRVDLWSDIDLQCAVDDDRVVDTIAAVEAVLPPVELRHEIPQPSWHGHWQAFYRFANASPFLLLDLAIVKISASEKFLTPETHGHAVVHFDKSHVVNVPALDQEAHRRRISNRIALLRETLPLFQIMTLKEVHRGNRIEALAFYQGLTLRPLVELLRIKYVPERYQFHTRYVYYDLPPEVVQRLEPLFFVADLEALVARHEEAHAWAENLLGEL